MAKQPIKLDAEPQPQEEAGVDKRPWVMDWLMEIGQDMAMINHCNEKMQYIIKDIENSENDEEIDRYIGKMNAYADLREAIYNSYNIKMSDLFDRLPDAQKDARCLLKHASYKVTLAMETRDARPYSEVAETNMQKAFNIFAMAVSLALGIEFSDCVRCLYDGIKDASDIIRSSDN